MTLRKLELKDAKLMLEWMKDERVNKFFRFDPDDITFETVTEFIRSSLDNTSNLHFAIAADNDEYMGTVSLKGISLSDGHAEYAISLRHSCQGKGAAKFATHEILKLAFEKLKLERVFLNVLSENFHAIGFYERIGFRYEGEFINHIKIGDSYKNLKWFAILKNEYNAL